MIFAVELIELLFFLAELAVHVGCWIAELSLGNPAADTRRGRAKVKVKAKRARLSARRAHRRGRCVLCKDALGQEPLVACSSCQADAHAECAQELTRDSACPTFGCAGRLRPSSLDLPGRERQRTPT